MFVQKDCMSNVFASNNDRQQQNDTILYKSKYASTIKCANLREMMYILLNATYNGEKNPLLIWDIVLANDTISFNLDWKIGGFPLLLSVILLSKINFILLPFYIILLDIFYTSYDSNNLQFNKAQIDFHHLKCFVIFITFGSNLFQF